MGESFVTFDTDLGGTPSTTNDSNSKIASGWRRASESIWHGGFLIGTGGGTGTSGGMGKWPVANSMRESPAGNEFQGEHLTRDERTM